MASLSDLSDSLKQLGIEQGDNVVVHSSLFSLGKIEEFAVNALPQAFLAGLELSLGNSGSVFVPTFNYDFPKSRFADLRDQPTPLGAFPEWFRTQPGVHRSGHPIFSICGKGPSAYAICQSDKPEFSAFGLSSTFNRLIENDAILLLQGIGLRVATVMVQIEAMLNVKYRFNKPFYGTTILQTGQKIEGEFNHFCFPINNAYRENYQPFEHYLLETGALKKHKVGRSSSYAIRLKRLLNEVERWLDKNPHGLLNCQPTHYYRFENGQEVTYPAFTNA